MQDEGGIDHAVTGLGYRRAGVQCRQPLAQRRRIGQVSFADDQAIRNCHLPDGLRLLVELRRAVDRVDHRYEGPSSR